MQIELEAVLVKTATKRAKRDKEGVVIEEPGILFTFEVPISVINPENLGALLRSTDREITVTLDDHQSSFDVRAGALVREPVAAR